MSTLKPIKINAANAAAIVAALAAVNGKADAHTYTLASEVMYVANVAESALADIGIAKARRAGAVYGSTSGSRVASAYKYSRIGTRIEMTRRSTEWYLTEVCAATLFGQAGRDWLKITAAQDAEAVAHLRSSYAVAKAVEPQLELTS